MEYYVFSLDENNLILKYTDRHESELDYDMLTTNLYTYVNLEMGHYSDYYVIELENKKFYVPMSHPYFIETLDLTSYGPYAKGLMDAEERIIDENYLITQDIVAYVYYEFNLKIYMGDQIINKKHQTRYFL